MHRRFVLVTLAGSVVFSLLLPGCATKHSSTSPTSSNNLAQQLSILQDALKVASNQKYTQIHEAGASSVGSPSDLQLGVPNDIKQTIDVNGTTSEISQDSAPSIYKTSDSLFVVDRGKWRKFTSHLPSTTESESQSVLQNVSANQLHSDFQTFNVKTVGTNELIYTLEPVAKYRSQFFGDVSKDLHRVMVGQDPYDWTMSIDALSHGSANFQSETLVLTLKEQNGSWILTDGTWNFTYTNNGHSSNIHLQESYTHQHIPVTIPANVSDGDAFQPTTSKAKHLDGQIISLVPINPLDIPNFYTTLNAYKMTYWSQNIPVIAYVAVPQQSGTYPLYVQCHGGFPGPTGTPVTHILSTGDSLLNWKVELAYAPKTGITVAPMYRGYGDSQGLVSGISDNATDTINAIKAIESKYKIEKGHVYLSGISMGGGVVLKVASEQTDIRSVIATSPYVGANIVMKWYLANTQSAMPHTKLVYNDLVSDYGSFDPNKPIYQKESIDYKKISAPTLLLQGTGDQEVQWQNVQTLYNDMKADNKKVEFDLVKGANHGFTGPHASDKQNAITLWYAKYGEGTS